MKIHIKNDEHNVFVGGTGSGKTLLAEHFLRRLNRVFVIDPKHEYKSDGYKVRRNLPAFGSNFRVIFRPKTDDDDLMDDLLKQLFKIKNVTIYCDELSTLADYFPRSTKRLTDIIRTGRSKHVSVWTAIQRPRFIPRVFLTETKGMFIFNLRGEDDRNYMSRFTRDIVSDPIEEFSFWYSHVRMPDISLLRYNLSKNFIEKIG